MICLIVSVDRTVDIPSLLPKSDAKVLLPVPEVPDNSIIIFFFYSIMCLIRNHILQTRSEAI